MIHMSIENLSLTPLEVLTFPLINHLRSRRERLLICPYVNPFTNPQVNFFRSYKSQLKIALIHVGKSAGESIMTYMHCALPPESFSLFEFHCFNADELIKDLLDDARNDPSIVLVIPIRDPLDRWVASFNWDYHYQVLSNLEPSTEFMRMINSFPKVQDLARGIVANDRDACRFGRLTHMGNGVSWYLPDNRVDSIPKERTYVIRVEHISHDLAFMINDLAKKMSIHNAQAPKHVPLTKANYKAAYPANTFGSLKDFSSSDTQQMKIYLQEDYAVYQRLLALADTSNSHYEDYFRSKERF